MRIMLLLLLYFAILRTGQEQCMLQMATNTSIVHTNECFIRLLYENKICKNTILYKFWNCVCYPAIDWTEEYHILISLFLDTGEREMAFALNPLDMLCK